MCENKTNETDMVVGDPLSSRPCHLRCHSPQRIAYNILRLLPPTPCLSFPFCSLGLLLAVHFVVVVVFSRSFLTFYPILSYPVCHQTVEILDLMPLVPDLSSLPDTRCFIRFIFFSFFSFSHFLSFSSFLLLYPSPVPSPVILTPYSS